MSYVKFNENVIGYKKIRAGYTDYIVTLLIPRGAMIHSAMLGNKIRTTNTPLIYEDITGCKIDDGAKLTGRHSTHQSYNNPRHTEDMVFYEYYKCRAECAEVLQIEELGTNKLRESVTTSFFGKGGVLIETEYLVGDMVYPHEFYTGDADSYFIIHTPVYEGGIHFFPERWMAELY